MLHENIDTQLINDSDGDDTEITISYLLELNVQHKHLRKFFAENVLKFAVSFQILVYLIRVKSSCWIKILTLVKHLLNIHFPITNICSKVCIYFRIYTAV